MKKRLAALEKKFSVRRFAYLIITKSIAKANLNGVPFKIERGPEEGLDAFRARALRAAQARFPGAELFPVNMREEDLRL